MLCQRKEPTYWLKHTRSKQEATQTCESKGFKRQLLVGFVFFFRFFALDKENKIDMFVLCFLWFRKAATTLPHLVYMCAMHNLTMIGCFLSQSSVNDIPQAFLQSD